MKDVTELLGAKEWPAGKSIGGIYEIRGVIGRGGFGLVYQAYDQAAHKDIAVKVPLGREEYDTRGQKRLVRFVESPSAKASLVEEVRAWIRLAHPHVVRAFDAIDDQSTDYLPAIFMDLCAGGSLHEKIYGREPLTVVEGLDVAIQVCWGMEYVHQQGLVHRDLKPGNVLLAREGKGRLGKALVSDLGLAKALGTRGVEPSGPGSDGDEAALWVTVSQAGGTPMYMPPEQWKAGTRLGAASDVYAFGVMLYEIFCRRLPFDCGNSLKAWQRAHREESVPEPGQFNRAIPTELAKLMKACVAKEPTARPHGFGGLGEELVGIYRQQSAENDAAVRTKPTAVEVTAEMKKAQASIQLRVGLGALRRGDLKVAQREFEEAATISRALGDRKGLSASLGNQALILQNFGRMEEAMGLMKEDETICRLLGDRTSLSESLGNQATVFIEWGRMEEAMGLLKEQELICRTLASRPGLAHSLGNQALILQFWGRLEEAMGLHKEEESVCRRLADRDALQVCLMNQAEILKRRGRLEEAMALLTEQESICRVIGNRAGIGRSLGCQAQILHQRGQMEEAMELLKEQESIARTLGDQRELANSLGDQALVLKAWGQLEVAMGLLKQQELLYRTLKDRAGLPGSLGNQATILGAYGRLDEAMVLHKEEESIYRVSKDQAGLSRSLGNQATIQRKSGRLLEAMDLLKEQESICRTLEDRAGLATSLGNQALILKEWGRLEEAMHLLNKQESIMRALGNPDGLASSLANQAFFLGLHLSRRNEAVAKAEEAMCLCTQHGLAALAPQVQRILDAVRSQGR